MSTLVIVNPAAGRGRVGQMLFRVQEEVRELSRRHGAQIRLEVTQGPGDARRLAEGGGFDRVVAVGGDGTVHEIVQGMNHAAQSLAVVPIGSGNDFARALGLFGVPWQRALEVALTAQTRPTDLGEVNGELFASSLSMGFDAHAAQTAQTAPAVLQGMPRYLYAIFAVLGRLSLPELVLEAGGKPLFRGRSLLAAFMNTPTYGSGFRMAPHASPADGLLSGVVAGEFSRLGVLGILPKVALGTHIGHPRIATFDHPAFTARWSQPVPAQADGEPLSARAEFSVRLHPGRLQAVWG